MNKIVNKAVALSLVLSPMLMAETVDMAEVEINESVNSVKINDISGEELKSADLAESLTRTVPSVSLVRRSGIANDIILRGQKKDNINILADGTKTYGACPNRMDPATSHILTNNIESVEIKEGPYDVENFGTLSGLVDIKTKKPKEEVSGEVNLNAGSFNQKKISATVSGGYEMFRVLLSASKESSDQYKDGNGDTFADQVDNYIANKGGNPGNAYQERYKDLKAYDKKSFMGKLFFNPTDNQEVRFSFTANRSDDILYPSSPMDATRDDSDIYNLEYSLTDIGSWSKKLDFQVYQSEVDHPMSTVYRAASLNPMMGVRENALTTKMQGAKVKNVLEVSDADITLGLDTSKRNWDGHYSKNDVKTGVKSIDDVDTTNMAVFGKYEQSFGRFDIEVGARYDDTNIKPSSTDQENDYSTLSAYAYTTYNAEGQMEYFAGAGKASRVPDARELYFVGYGGNHVGTADLDEVNNYEIDLGFKKQFEGGFFKTKVFHSWLKDYIYYNSSNKNMMNMPVNSFENIDATIYGIELSGSYTLNDATYVDMGLAYQRGQKDEALDGQSNTDLAEIPPLKVNVALNYDTEMTASKVELIAADKWSNFDSDNGEQELSGYAIVNLKWNRDLTKGFDVTLGMDNVFDHAYAISNTYQDLTLLSSGAGDEVVLMNEPGRYVYINLRYRF